MTRAAVITIIVILAIALGAYFVISQPSPSADIHNTAGDKTRDAATTEMMKPAAEQKPVAPKKSFPQAPELVNPTGFVNTEPLTLEDLRGKVVMVKFWTFACINCQRTLPHVNALYDKYRDQGFEIVGVHTPEFAYEHKTENVAAAIDKWGIEFPVVQDNNYETWRAYGNRYWPRLYLLNRDGEIVYDHIGEGAYEETDRRVRELLAEQ